MTAPGLVRHHLLEVPLEGTPAIERSRVTRIDLAPGAPTGPHRHPCDVVGYVLEGTIRYRIDGEPERTLHPGDAFHEPKGVRMAAFDNASGTEPAAFLVCYLLSPGVEKIIEML
jgi:quercetin dioxygenase-like cupin family protein